MLRIILRYFFVLIVLTVCGLLFPITLSGQSSYLDSVIKTYRFAPNDSVKVGIINTIIENDNDDASWPRWNSLMHAICQRNLLSRYRDINRNWFLRHDGFYHNNLGYIFYDKGRIDEALDEYHKALKLFEEIDYAEGIGITLNNIGVVYDDLDDTTRALAYYRRALALHIKNKHEPGIAYALNNIGVIYDNWGSPDKALDCYYKSLAIKRKLHNIEGIAFSFHNIGFVYKRKGDFVKAKEYFDQALKLRDSIGDLKGVAQTTNAMFEVYYNTGQFDEAFKLAKSGLELSEQIGFPELVGSASSNMYRISRQRKDYSSALKYYSKMIQMNDSTHNNKLRNASLRRQFQYEYEKRALADSIKSIGEREILDAKVQQGRTTRFALVGGLIALSFFSYFLFDRFRQMRKQKQVIEFQKKEIEAKQKEIIDSIKYAYFIQQSLLPSTKKIKQDLERFGKSS